MRLSGMRLAEALGNPSEDRNLSFGVIRHLWRSPVPFVGFYPPEGVEVTENRLYVPTPPRLVDDTEYLAGAERHKQAYARELEQAMNPSGSLRGYFEVPTDAGWRFAVDLAGRSVKLEDGRGKVLRRSVSGDLAPFVWAYRHSGFCIITVYDKDTDALRDDLLFFAKREGVEIRWRRKAA